MISQCRRSVGEVPERSIGAVSKGANGRAALCQSVLEIERFSGLVHRRRPEPCPLISSRVKAFGANPGANAGGEKMPSLRHYVVETNRSHRTTAEKRAAPAAIGLQRCPLGPPADGSHRGRFDRAHGPDELADPRPSGGQSTGLCRDRVGPNRPRLPTRPPREPTGGHRTPLLALRRPGTAARGLRLEGRKWQKGQASRRH